MKQINLKINNCIECPFRQYSDVEEYQCKLTNNLLFFDETHIVSEDKLIATPIIHKTCTLEDFTQTKTINKFYCHDDGILEGKCDNQCSWCETYQRKNKS